MSGTQTLSRQLLPPQVFYQALIPFALLTLMDAPLAAQLQLILPDVV
jgi:hypothetical protein